MYKETLGAIIFLEDDVEEELENELEDENELSDDFEDDPDEVDIDEFDDRDDF